MSASEKAVKVMKPIDEVRETLYKMESQFKLALPPHIAPEKFIRIALTGLQTNPDLIQCTRPSYIGACMKCAQIGLLPDGREATIVSYRNKDGEFIATFQPMIAGLMKLVRNSGEIETWDLEVVKSNDTFDYQRGDEPYIKHKPALSNRGEVIGAYSIVCLKSGEKTRDWMDVDEIEKIRARSRSKDKGPWVSDYEEMCKKTVGKRHYKRLPSSADLDEAMHADDEISSIESISVSHDDDIKQLPETSTPRLTKIIGNTQPQITASKNTDSKKTDEQLEREAIVQENAEVPL